jgi:hypothetical protein
MAWRRSGLGYFSVMHHRLFMFIGEVHRQSSGPPGNRRRWLSISSFAMTLKVALYVLRNDVKSVHDARPTLSPTCKNVP